MSSYQGNLFVSLLLMSCIVVAPFGIAAGATPSIQPRSRPFLMGFTPMNFDDSPESTARVGQFLIRHAEVVSLYIEGGVPWPEAMEDRPFPAPLQARIEAERKRIGPGHKVFLAINSLKFGRNGLAGYCGPEGATRRPGKWAAKGFDDPEIIESYSKYAVRMIDIFGASYLAYGVEVNQMAGQKKEFEKFATFAAGVYQRIKTQRPAVMVFPTIQIDEFHRSKDPRVQEGLKRLMPYADAVAVSSYPHTAGHTPQTLPADWFTSVAALAPGKPFIVAETGFSAAPYHSNFLFRKVDVEATPQMQVQYLKRVLSDAQGLNAVFVNWFFVEDIDAYWAKQTNLLAKSLVYFWRDAGLLDENLNPRPSLAVWDLWLARPIARDRIGESVP